MSHALAREMWRLLEPLHSIVYFEPTARDVYRAAGLRGYWMGYFGSRAACLGPAPSGVVVAAFYNFHPRMIERAIPDAWSLASPDEVLEARHRVADAAWERVLGDADPQIVTEAAELVLAAMEPIGSEGRVLYGGNRSLPTPKEPHLRLWHAATLYREYRGDGHVAALLTHGCGPLDALLLAVASGAASRESLQPHRGWNDDEWASGTETLAARGLLDATGAITPAGAAMRQNIEGLTDDLSMPPWRATAERDRDRLVALLRPLADKVAERGGIPFPNAMAFTRERR